MNLSSLLTTTKGFPILNLPRLTGKSWFKINPLADLWP